MKRRFGASPDNGLRNILISALITLLALLIFWFAMNYTSASTVNRECETLEDAISRSISHCYAIEGFYPENLDYLVQNYGLTYDDEVFFVDYRPVGANVAPDYTVIVKGEM